MGQFRCGAVAALAVGLALAMTPGVAQTPRWAAVPALGDDAEERARLHHLLGSARWDGFLVRSPSARLQPLPGDSTRLRWAWVEPEVRIVHNSAMPFSLNDGLLWAGRGWSESVRAGLRAEWGRWSLVLAPEVVATENLWYELPPHDVRLPLPPGRSPLSSPWHVGDYSIDYPLRFGEQGFRELDFGQSTLAVDLGPVEAGLSTENEWWGPGIRNAIVLSNNASGIWRAFVRTTKPVRTRLGTLNARWFLGGLFESQYFDNAAANDRRSVTGIATTFTPAAVPALTLGFTRTVFAPLERWDGVFGHALDVFLPRGQRVAPGDSVARPRRDQIFSVFGRWVFPDDGFGVHFEWARTKPPESLRDFLTSPNHTQGYTLGLEWARPLNAGEHAVRVQAEVTYLENSPAYRNLPEFSFYTSAVAPQGYTQRGQVIGASIGPGASSQWLGVDYFARSWRVGVFGGRIRWDDDALYQFPNVYYANKWCAHDVSLFAGLRGALRGPFGTVEAVLTRGARLNVFFYHITWCGPTAARQDVLDVVNTTLELRATLAP